MLMYQIMPLIFHALYILVLTNNTGKHKTMNLMGSTRKCTVS